MGKAMDSLGNSNMGDPVGVPDDTHILEQEPARSLGEAGLQDRKLEKESQSLEQAFVLIGKMQEAGHAEPDCRDKEKVSWGRRSLGSTQREATHATCKPFSMLP